MAKAKDRVFIVADVHHGFVDGYYFTAENAEHARLDRNQDRGGQWIVAEVLPSNGTPLPPIRDAATGPQRS